MRVLQVHSRYRQGGGEDRVVDAEATLLRSASHEVVQHIRANPHGAVESAEALARAPWNRAAAREVAALARRVRPDVIHIHNTWFALSPAVIAACAAEGFPVIVTLHNYRIVCIAGTFFREGRSCTECLSHGALPGVVHRCYRGSAVLSGIAAATVALHAWRETWAEDVRLFLAPSPVVRDTVVQAGLPAEKVRVKPHFTADPGVRAVAPSASNRVLFAGRLAAEKGLTVLLDAWAEAAPEGLELAVAGDGPLASTLRRRGVPGVRYLGQLGQRALSREMHTARALAFPSVWQEPFGLVLLEAMAHGLPVAGSAVGSTRWILEPIETFQLVAPGDVAALSASLRLLADPAFIDSAGAAGRAGYEARFTPTANLLQLEDAYRVAAA